MRIRFPFIGRRKALISREHYWISNIFWWFYTIAWISALIFIWYGWKVSSYYKAGVTFFLILFAPSLSDLLKNYDTYKKEWETKYKSKESN